MSRFFSFILYVAILGVSVFTLFYLFHIQSVDKKNLERMSQLNGGFKILSKISIDKIEVNDFRSIFEAYSQNGRNPGLAIGITYGVRTFPFYFGSTGTDGKPINDKTLFEIGAVTQTFTGLWLARMMEQQKLPPNPLLNQILGSSTPLDLKSIRLLDLATHTAGFPKMPLNFPSGNANENPFAHYSSDSLWSSLSTIQPEKIGTYQYSNYGYAALGESLARFRGSPFPTLLRQEILTPLGLQSMRFGTEGDPAPPYQMAIPHRDGRTTFRLPLYAFDPAGGLCSTLPDLLKYINIMTYPDRSPFPITLKLATKPWKKSEETLGLGLGWYVSPHPFGTIIWKNGGAGGFRSYVGYWDDLPLGVVILANSDDELIDLIGIRLLQALREL
ncbi:MAG: serine hydrolase domain-containing protein [Verrucomicrobiota bacterium]